MPAAHRQWTEITPSTPGVVHGIQTGTIMKPSSHSVPLSLFQPYTPPNEGAGLITVDRDLCWRLNPRGLVTPAVIGAIVWARNFRMTDQHHQSILDGLGLEYNRLPGGTTVLRPQDRYRLVSGSERIATDLFNLTTPQMPLIHYDAVEVYGCIQDENGIHRFEVNEHPEGAKPLFWSVSLHLAIGGHIETIADFPKENQAETFALVMTDLVRTARQARGLDTSLLYAM